ncbi:MAG: CBS domain-containing protein [Caldilineaceae bacterium]
MEQIHERMSSPPITVQADSSYQRALRLMDDHQLHHLPVVNATGQLVGIITERDLLLAASHYGSADIEVAEIMHKGAVTASPAMTIAQAAELMLQKRIGGLPVVNEQQHVVGVITETDLLRAFVEMLGVETVEQ